MKKYILIFYLIIMFLFSGCGCNDIRINSLKEVQIKILTPDNDKEQKYSAKIIKIIKDKKQMKYIAKAFENAKKINANLGLEETIGIRYEIMFVYKTKGIKSFYTWIEKDWDNAIFDNFDYYNIGNEETKLLKKLIYE